MSARKMERGPRLASGTLGRGFLSQALSSLGNGLAVLAVAGASSPGDFGVFALAYAALAFMLAVLRVSFGATIARLAADPAEVARETAMVVGLLIASSPLLVTVPWLVAHFAAGSTPTTVLLLSLFAPLILIQDILRYSAIAGGAGNAAVLGDGIWAIFAAVGFAWRVASDPQPTAVLGLWGLGAAVALAILVAGTRVRVRFRVGIPRVAGGWRSRAHLLGAGVAGSSSVLAAAAIITATAGPSVTASLAGTGQLFAPMSVTALSLSFAVAPAVSGRSAASQRRVFSLAAGAVALAAALWAVVLALLPLSLGVALLGDTWHSAVPLIPAYALQAGLVGAGAAGASLATNIGATRQLWRLRVFQAVLRVCLIWVAAVVVGTSLALAWTEVLVLTIVALILWPWLVKKTRTDAPAQVGD